MPLKVLHLSTYDSMGGAGRAAYSLHRALLKHGVTSQMRVGSKFTDDPTVVSGSHRLFTLSRLLDRQLWRVQKSKVSTWRSPARFSSVSADEINSSGADVVNLHWITDGFISVEEIGKIKLPIVWSMYDAWPFSGTEHYGHLSSMRWREGYTRNTRPAGDVGFDLDRWTYRRKETSWLAGGPDFHMIPASEWLESLTQQSALMKKWPVTRIPHAVDTDQFSPMNSSLARSQLRLPLDVPILLFVASAGISDYRKGWDLLEPAIRTISSEFRDLHVIIVGPKPDHIEQSRVRAATSVQVHWNSVTRSDEELRTLYAAANVTVVPSRQDNLPLVAMEAQSVGTPVVGLNTSGLRDLVTPGSTGFLVDGENSDALADGIAKSLELGTNLEPREWAVSQWSGASVAARYLTVYEER